MSDRSKCSLVYWWQYEARVFNNAWHDVGFLSFIISAVSGVLVASLFYWFDMKGVSETKMTILAGLGGTTITFLLQFAFKLFTSAADMVKTLELEKHQLESELGNFKEQVSSLKISPAAIHSNSDWKTPIGISITNPSQTAMAENVSVKLLKIAPAFGRRDKNGLNTDNCGILPLTASQYATENYLNAGDSAKFDLFFVAPATLKKRIIGGDSRVLVAFPPYSDSGGDFLYHSPPFEINEVKEYFLSVEVTAKNRLKSVAQFKVRLSIIDDDSLKVDLVKV